MTQIESEVERLEALRGKQAASNSAIATARNEIARCGREIGEVRVAGVLFPEENPWKTVEARCKKLESELKAAQGEIDTLTPQVAALSGAIEQLEREIGPKRHAARVASQNEARKSYAAVAREILEAANALSACVAKARAIHFSASQEFPKAEECEGHAPVMQSAGLPPIWDPTWINYGDGSRRDVFVGAIYDFDSSLVDQADPVARLRVHQESERKRRASEIERERAERTRRDREEFRAANPLEDGARITVRRR